LPALVIAPCRRRSPEEFSLGISPEFKEEAVRSSHPPEVLKYTLIIS
jgi:hypothetical protein